jgi:replicative DNA helicase
MPTKKEDVNKNHPNLKAREMPKHIAAEKAVLCCILVDDKAAQEIFPMLEPEDFYLRAHTTVYDAMRTVAYRNAPVDLVTLVQQLEEMGELENCGGVAYLTDIAGEMPSAANFKHYVGIVKKNAKLRKIIATGNKMIDIAYTGDPDDEALNVAEKEIFDLSGENDSGEMKDIQVATNSVLDRLEKLAADPKAMRGIPTGFASLNRRLNGLQRSDLILIAARPGQGKTSIGMNIIQNVAMNRERRTESGNVKPYVCAVFSLEMPAEQLVKRMLCSVAKVDMTRVNAGTLEAAEWKRLAEAKARLDKSKIYIFDSAQTTPMELLSRCRRLKREQGLDVVMIDYLQLMTTGKRVESRQLEISEITRTLKIAARELDVPILLLSQMSREVEKRTNRRPQMSDLRESGAIEQDADIIMFIYREHDMTDTSVDAAVRDKVELIIAKHRNGEPGSVEMRWAGKYVSFVDVDNSKATAQLEKSAPPVDKTGNFDGAEEYAPQERTAADILSADDGDDDGLGY